jgi:hypothetical protein
VGSDAEDFALGTLYVTLDEVRGQVGQAIVIKGDALYGYGVSGFGLGREMWPTPRSTDCRASSSEGAERRQGPAQKQRYTLRHDKPGGQKRENTDGGAQIVVGHTRLQIVQKSTLHGRFAFTAQNGGTGAGIQANP